MDTSNKVGNEKFSTNIHDSDRIDASKKRTDDKYIPLEVINNTINQTRETIPTEFEFKSKALFISNVKHNDMKQCLMDAQKLKEENPKGARFLGSLGKLAYSIREYEDSMSSLSWKDLTDSKQGFLANLSAYIAAKIFPTSTLCRASEFLNVNKQQYHWTHEEERQLSHLKYMPVVTVSLRGGAKYEGTLLHHIDSSTNKPHGYGTIKYKDGTIYEGFFKEGNPEGKGILTYPDKTIYEGTFKNGKPSGDIGIHKNTNGEIIYQGSYSRGKYEGNGKINYINSPDFKYKDLEKSYEGKFNDGKRTDGTLIYNDGRKFEGTFDALELPNYGTLIQADGTKEKIGEHSLIAFLKGIYNNI